MDDGEPRGGPIVRGLLRLIGRLPMPIQSFAYWTIERFALFIVLVLVLPVLIITFIVSTVIFGALSTLLGSSSGPLGAILGLAWLASWTVLPVVITVRMWRSIPTLKALVAVATGSLDVEPEPAVTIPDRTTFHERIALADASLSPKPADGPMGDDPPPDGRSTV